MVLLKQDFKLKPMINDLFWGWGWGEHTILEPLVEFPLTETFSGNCKFQKQTTTFLRDLNLCSLASSFNRNAIMHPHHFRFMFMYIKRV